MAPRSHPSSPVQVNQRPLWPLFVVPIIASVAWWSFQQPDAALPEKGPTESAPQKDGAKKPVTSRAIAKATLATLFTSGDYPRQALANDLQGTTGFALDVGPNGRVRSCRIVTSSGHRSLDKRTCSVLRSRARYTPARDASGRNVADTDHGRVKWVLPSE